VIFGFEKDVFLYIQIGDIKTPFDIDKVEINAIDYINTLPTILNMIAFTQDIESIIIENFLKAKKSITIVMAWFTNSDIIEGLLKARKYSNIDIEVLVDSNEINNKYFLGKHKDKLEKAGIKIKSQTIRNFNHNKFSVIDNVRIITGSYNYSKKANKNLENIVIFEDLNIASYYKRLFNYLTIPNYIDENIELLFENTDFANKIISTYYPFKASLFKRVQDKIQIGECFSHSNGLYDQISYRPGLIFNPKYTLHKELMKFLEKKKNNELTFEDIDSPFTQEFSLPIGKELLKSFAVATISDFNHSILLETASFNNTEIDYEEFGNDYEKLEHAVENYYTRKFEQTFNKTKLKSIINEGIDIIIEDYIWINNFKPFLNDDIVLNIYKRL
jgi:hypothetical protein